jgi:hypothetical protein
MRSPFSPGAFGRIAAFSMIGIAGVWVAYDLVGAVRWFAQDYRRLWQVGLAVIVGAPLLLIFLMLPASWRQRIGSCFWGIAASTVTGYAAYFLYACWRLREALAVGGGWWLMVVVVLMVWGCAAWLWWVVWERVHARPTA